MDENKNDKSKADQEVPIPDPLGLLEGLTDGRYFDPVRRKLRRKIREKILGWARELEET